MAALSRARNILHGGAIHRFRGISPHIACKRGTKVVNCCTRADDLERQSSPDGRLFGIADDLLFSCDVAINGAWCETFAHTAKGGGGGFW